MVGPLSHILPRILGVKDTGTNTHKRAERFPSGFNTNEYQEPEPAFIRQSPERRHRHISQILPPGLGSSLPSQAGRLSRPRELSCQSRSCGLADAVEGLPKPG